MELDKWLDKKVRIILSNDFAYIGKVIATDSNSITIIDKTNSRVCLKEETISCIKELGKVQQQ